MGKMQIVSSLVGGKKKVWVFKKVVSRQDSYNEPREGQTAQ